MARHAWFKFNPTAWRADLALGSCSVEARYLWLEMLGVMHEATPRGHLLIKGKTPSIDTLAALAKMKKTAVKRALFELETAEVFSKNEAGIIMSRRMVRESEMSERAEENANRRWQTGEKINGNGNADAYANPHAKNMREREEEKERKKESPPTPPTKSDGGSAAPDGAGGGDSGPSKSVDMPKWMEPYFEKWWAAYPLKKRKLQARPVFRRAWAKIEPAAGKEGPEGRMATLMAGTAAYVAEIAAKGTTPDKIAHPTTWLNGGGWADEYQATGTLKPVEQRGALY